MSSNDETPTVRLGGGLSKNHEIRNGWAVRVDHLPVRIETESLVSHYETDAPYHDSFLASPKEFRDRPDPGEWRNAEWVKKNARCTIEERFLRAFMEADEREVQEFVTAMQARIAIRETAEADFGPARYKATEYVAGYHYDPLGQFRASTGEPEPEKSPLDKALELDTWGRIDGKFK